MVGSWEWMSPGAESLGWGRGWGNREYSLADQWWLSLANCLGAWRGLLRGLRWWHGSVDIDFLHAPHCGSWWDSPWFQTLLIVHHGKWIHTRPRDGQEIYLQKCPGREAHWLTLRASRYLISMENSVLIYVTYVGSVVMCQGPGWKQVKLLPFSLGSRASKPIDLTNIPGTVHCPTL